MAKKTPISELPEGTRVKLLKLHPLDGYYDRKKDFEGKVFIAKKDPRYNSMSFIKEGSDHSYVFFMGTTYKILIPEKLKSIS